MVVSVIVPTSTDACCWYLKGVCPSSGGDVDLSLSLCLQFSAQEGDWDVVRAHLSIPWGDLKGHACLSPRWHRTERVEGEVGNGKRDSPTCKLQMMMAKTHPITFTPTSHTYLPTLIITTHTHAYTSHTVTHTYYTYWTHKHSLHWYVRSVGPWGQSPLQWTQHQWVALEVDWWKWPSQYV